MKEKTHAWLALMAVSRLQHADLNAEARVAADALVDFLMSYRDDVTRGAWYPDAVYRDNANSHVLKMTPTTATGQAAKLPNTSRMAALAKKSPVADNAMTTDPDDNLPERCESIAHSVIENLKILHTEDKGSPVACTNNHIALLLFALSHYIADAHVPFHADARPFSSGANIHGRVEGVWEKEIRDFYPFDEPNDRYLTGTDGLPARTGDDATFNASFLSRVLKDVQTRNWVHQYGAGNRNIGEYARAICDNAVRVNYALLPQALDPDTVTAANWTTLGTIDPADLHVAVLTDAVDAIARVWLHIWMRHLAWMKEKD